MRPLTPGIRANKARKAAVNTRNQKAAQAVTAIKQKMKMTRIAEKAQMNRVRMTKAALIPATVTRATRKRKINSFIFYMLYFNYE
jgi:hypothetical protein